MQLSRDSGVPLHRQIEASFRDGIRAGRLPRGTPLPATRRLAADLGVSRGVVIEAYQQLVAEGYLASRSGGYTRVAIGAEPVAAPEPARAAVLDERTLQRGVQTLARAVGAVRRGSVLSA